jgi:hypothetical protein
MKFLSFDFPASASFLDIIRLLDKVQKHTTTHLLDSEDVKKCLYFHDYLKKYAGRVYVEAYSGYSFKGFKFPCTCSHLLINDEGGFVRRMTAPEGLYGKGSRYLIHLLDRNKESLFTLRMPFYVKSNSENHLILASV